MSKPLYQSYPTALGSVIPIWEDTSIHTESGTHESSTGKSTRVFKREGDKWLCLHAHFTYIPSPKAQVE